MARAAATSDAFNAVRVTLNWSEKSRSPQRPPFSNTRCSEEPGQVSIGVVNEGIRLSSLVGR
jgi:hypothetical protein